MPTLSLNACLLVACKKHASCWALQGREGLKWRRHDLLYNAPVHAPPKRVPILDLSQTETPLVIQASVWSRKYLRDKLTVVRVGAYVCMHTCPASHLPLRYSNGVSRLLKKYCLAGVREFCSVSWPSTCLGLWGSDFKLGLLRIWLVKNRKKWNNEVVLEATMYTSQSHDI